MKRNCFITVFTLALACAAFVALVVLHGCGSSSGGGAATGTLKVALTDNISTQFDHVFISIKEIRLVPNGMENARDDDPGLPVIASFSQPKKVDVLTLRFLQEYLGEAVVPAGTYNQVRLVLAANNGSNNLANYLEIGDNTNNTTYGIEMSTPSAQQSGLKIVGKFEVKPGVINAIALDFDPDKAIVEGGGGKYTFKPTGIRIVQMADVIRSYGSLSGAVSPFTAYSTAVIYVTPRGGVSPIAAGSVDLTDGTFRAFVPSGEYRLKAVAARFLPYSSVFYNVSSGHNTVVGTIQLSPVQ